VRTAAAARAREREGSRTTRGALTHAARASPPRADHIPVDWQAFIGDYVAAGGTAADLIEPVDGFHPSQTGNYVIAQIVWNQLLANKPDWLPPVNPFNAQIAARFGADLNGY
jgi:hypothetical protein